MSQRPNGTRSRVAVRLLAYAAVLIVAVGGVYVVTRKTVAPSLPAAQTSGPKAKGADGSGAVRQLSHSHKYKYKLFNAMSR